MPPITVSLADKQRKLVAGTQYTFSCLAKVSAMYCILLCILYFVFFIAGCNFMLCFKYYGCLLEVLIFIFCKSVHWTCFLFLDNVQGKKEKHVVLSQTSYLYLEPLFIKTFVMKSPSICIFLKLAKAIMCALVFLECLSRPGLLPTIPHQPQ